MRLAASAGAISLVAMAVGAGTGSAADPAGIPDAAIQQMFADWESGQSSSGADPLKVIVGKVVAGSTTASGESLGQGLYVATNVMGNGSAQVTVPMGTSSPLDVSSVDKLATQGDSIVYDINNSGGQVQQMVASGGKYEGPMPITFEVDITVNGEKVDADEATSLTGDVELNYNFTNHTNKVQTVKYKDAKGNIRKKTTNVPVPFYVHYSGVFGKGWAAIVAPWANAGFSTGETLTGGLTFMPSVLNKQSPDGTLTIKGRAENAKLPAVALTATPKSTSGAISTIAGQEIDKYGAEVEHILGDEALPLLLKIEKGLGAAGGKVGQVLNEKVDPILAMLSRLHIDPKKADSLLEKGGKDVAGVGDLLLSINQIGEQTEQKLAEVADRLASPKTQAVIAKVVAKLDWVDGLFDKYMPILKKVEGYADEFGAAIQSTFDEIAQGLGEKDFYTLVSDLVLAELRKKGLCPQEGSCALLPTAMAAVQDVLVNTTQSDDYPKGVGVDCSAGPPCLGTQTVGEVLDAFAIDKLDSTCTTGDATRTAWTPSLKSSFDQGVTYLKNHGGKQADIDNMNQLEKLLVKQGSATWNVGDCVAAGKRMEKQLDDILDNVGTLGHDLDDVISLMNTLKKGVDDVKAGLIRLSASLPKIRAALEKKCGDKTVFDDLSDCGLIQALSIVADANGAAATELNEGVLEIVEAVEPALNEIFAIANGVFTAAPHIQSTVDELPALISQLAYGTIGGFVKDVEGLEGLADKLIDVSSETVSINEAMDKQFQAGVGFPYGSAQGGGAATQAIYTFAVAAPGGTDAPLGTKIVFIVVLLLIGGGLGTWMYMRAKPE